MKIISKFKDYYDGMGYGFDDSVVYERLTSATYVDHLDSNHITEPTFKYLESLPSGNYVNTHTSYSHDALDLSVSPICLFFCGEFIPILKLVWGSVHSYDSVRSYIYTIEQFEDQFNGFLNYYSNPDKREALQYYNAKLGYYYDSLDICKTNLTRVLNSDGFKNTQTRYSLEHFRTPVILFEKAIYSSRRTMTLNPSLLNLNFQSYMDGVTVYQRIEQYFSNDLVKPDVAEKTTGDDKVLAQSKGFDVKMSFRQAAPGDKKLRRKQNKLKKKVKNGNND